MCQTHVRVHFMCPSSMPALHTQVDLQLRLARLRPRHEARLLRQHRLLWADLRSALAEVPISLSPGVHAAELTAALEAPHSYFAPGRATTAARRHYLLARLHMRLMGLLRTHAIAWEALATGASGITPTELEVRVSDVPWPITSPCWPYLEVLDPSRCR